MVGDYFESTIRGRILKIIVNEICEIAIPQRFAGMMVSERRVKGATLRVNWDGALLHAAEAASATGETNEFRVPLKEGDHEDQQCVYAFWNTEASFWFLSIWVEHINENTATVEIGIASDVIEDPVTRQRDFDTILPPPRP